MTPSCVSSVNYCHDLGGFVDDPGLSALIYQPWNTINSSSPRSDKRTSCSSQNDFLDEINLGDINSWLIGHSSSEIIQA